MKRFFGIALVIMMAASLFFAAASVGAEDSGYFNGFETDLDGWYEYNSEMTIVSSGHNGITSADGDNHVVITPPMYDTWTGVFTRWGGYSSVWPEGGFYTELDIYLDVEYATSNVGQQFDFTSAVSKKDGDFRRDYIFSVGTTDEGFVMSASNNSPGWPANPGRNPVNIYTSGWYTFRHNFRDVADVLTVEMEVIDSNGNVVGSWTLSDPTDIISTIIGGNRYGWFCFIEFPELAIDNAERGYLVPPVIDVDVDIKPGSQPNSINLKSRGVVPVAILSSVDFDAAQVDPATVLFEGASPVRWAFGDVNEDGILDLLFHFKTQELEILEDDVDATLTGETFDGTSIEGSDSVNIVPIGKAKGH